MEYKGIRFEIVETTNPCRWKWIVFLTPTRMRTGVALTRADAVLDAESAIEEALGGFSVTRARTLIEC